MIDHMTFRIRDIDQARKFYVPCLSTIGYTLIYDKINQGKWVLGFAQDGKPADTFFTNEQPAGGPAHIAWLANSAEQVDAFFDAVVAAGGRVHTPPGKRESYFRNYYNALIYDLDGNLIEAVIHL